jgi:protein-S-isoprenylcysteine O-methyltransferase Ste14
MNGLFARALLAFLLLPGMVGFVVPLTLIDPRLSRADWRAFEPLGLLPLVAGIIILLWCVREFHVAGKGTLAPWMPPKHLVVSGLYRLSRNPMYVGVSLILWGWAIGFQSRPLTAYALVVMLAFHLRIVFGEEPWLAETHGAQWQRYKASVPRWLGFRLGPRL